MQGPSRIVEEQPQPFIREDVIALRAGGKSKRVVCPRVEAASLDRVGLVQRTRDELLRHLWLAPMHKDRRQGELCRRGDRGHRVSVSEGECLLAVGGCTIELAQLTACPGQR